jgi:1-acyl-sn-glycerol-3-phosphate acyltransferase
LRQVRLAVGSQALRLPIAFIREFLLACGCIPADRVSIRNALRSGCSVAITPGGWREGGLFGSYKLIIKQRRGFVQLAHETGVLLVPVLCLGEQDLAQAPINGPILWGFRLVQTFRPQPVKVVFGQVS